MTFKKAFLAILGVILIHIVLMATGAYYLLGSLDIPMHFLGGFVMAMLGMAIHHQVSSRAHTNKVPWWYHYLFVIGFAMLIGVAWEFHEYVLDNTLNIWLDWPESQLSLSDTMGDFVLDWIGATIAFFAFRKSL